MTMTLTPISADLLATRAKKVPLYKAFVLPVNLADVEALRLNIPHRSKGAVEVRTIAKQLGASFDGKEWQIARSKIEGATGQECVAALNALRLVEGVKWIERQRIAREMGIKTIYLKVPYDQRGLASADGARWVADTAIRRWAFTVVPNDSAFSTLISKWEELGMVDADFTEEKILGSRAESDLAKSLRPKTPTVQQFNSTCHPCRVAPKQMSDTTDSDCAEYLFRKLITHSPLILEDEKIIRSTTISLDGRGRLPQNRVYTITIYYLNPLFSSSVPATCQSNPSVMVYTNVSTNMEHFSHRGYYMDATQMRKFWDVAIVNRFVVGETIDHSKKDMLQEVVTNHTKDLNFIKTVAWGLEHDPVFSMGGLHTV